MTTIALEGMEFYAYHGFYDEETKIGTTFIVDIEVRMIFSKGASSDALEGTVNYETIYFICKQEMKKTSKLLENVAYRIIGRLKSQFGQISSMKVCIKKMNPPLGGKVHSAIVTIDTKQGGKGDGLMGMFG